MYPNLEAELARRKFNYKDIARAIAKDPRTARNKLNGTTSFTLVECLAIKDILFPELQMDIGDLFYKE